MININIKSEVQSEAFKTSVWLFFLGQMFGEGRRRIRSRDFFVLFEVVAPCGVSG